METNEQGLTKEEKIMFGILGLILIIAIGVLIINSFSANERKLEDSKTPITETQGQKEDKTEDETITDNQKESLIEDSPLENVAINTVVSNQPSTKPTQTVTKPSTPENKEDNLGTGNTEVPGIIEWFFKDTMITSAYSNEIITIDRNVILKDGTEVEAVVTIRKLEGNSWNIIDISSNKINVTEGLYKYYYTYGNQTKELLLTVKNKLQLEKIEFLKLSEVYTEDMNITEEEFTKYQNILLNSKLTAKENTYTLETIKLDDTTPIVPIVLTLKDELTNPELNSTTLGITPSIENNNWYQTLTNKEIILWLDLSVLDLTNQEINLNINGTDYYLNLTIVVKTTEEDQPEEDKEQNKDEITNEDKQEQEESPEEQPPKEETSPDTDNSTLDTNQSEDTSLEHNDEIEGLETLSNILEDSTNSVV